MAGSPSLGWAVRGCPELGGTAGWLAGADVPCTLCHRIGYSCPVCPCPAFPVPGDLGHGWA